MSTTTTTRANNTTGGSSSSGTHRMINLNSVLNDLICSVCLDFFAQPRTLSCQHTFCSKCLQPLIKENAITCPQCRRLMILHGASVDQVPKNILLTSLVESIQTAKAACPTCHEITVLNQCDHCSHIFCEKCLEKHVFNTLSGLEARLMGAVELSKRLDDLRERVDASEHEALQRLMNEADVVQAQIVNVFAHRKAALFAQAKRFYRSKLDDIERARFRLNASLSSKDELKKRLSVARQKAECLYATGGDAAHEKKISNKSAAAAAAATKAAAQSGNRDNDDRAVVEMNDAFVKEICNLESQIKSMEASVRDLMPSIDNSEQQELRLEYNQIDTADAFSKMIESMRIVTIDSAAAAAAASVNRGAARGLSNDCLNLEKEKRSERNVCVVDLCGKSKESSGSSSKVWAFNMLVPSSFSFGAVLETPKQPNENKQEKTKTPPTFATSRATAAAAFETESRVHKVAVRKLSPEYGGILNKKMSEKNKSLKQP